MSRAVTTKPTPAASLLAVFTGQAAQPRTLATMVHRGNDLQGVIEHGDTVFVEPGTVFDRDGFYVLNIGGSVRIRKLRVLVLTKEVSIECTDGRAPELVRLADIGRHFTIEGRVTGVGGFRRL